jgi:hypothetical protein
MSNDASGEGTALPPDEAFVVLGSEMRLEMLQTLGAADGALAFSELRDRLGNPDSGQFTYHLNKLVGHFASHDADGYEIRRAGERVLEAVLSGAVTDSPVVDSTLVDRACQYCGSPVGITYREEQLTVFCTGCEGIYGELADADGHGHLGTLFLPPAGLDNRTADEMLQAAYVWGELTAMASACGVCPRCSGVLTESVSICEDHDPVGAACGTCDERYAIGIHFECTNCTYDRGGAFGVKLLADTALLAFLTARGINPVNPSSQAAIGAMMDYDEEVLSVDPFSARFTFTAEGDSCTLVVDDELSVTDVIQD